MDRGAEGRKSRRPHRAEKLRRSVLGASRFRKGEDFGMAWRNRSTLGALAALTLALATPALAQKQYGPGVTDTEIKIGTTTPYSGPASAYSAGAVSATAYFAMINERGGVNGRKINFISLDDAYSPPKTGAHITPPLQQHQVHVL